MCGMDDFNIKLIPISLRTVSFVGISNVLMLISFLYNIHGFLYLKCRIDVNQIAFIEHIDYCVDPRRFTGKL